MKKISPHLSILGYNIFTGDLDHLLKSKKTVINTINQYSYCVAEKDPDFMEALKTSDVLLPDGIAIVKAAKFLKGEQIRKIAGADLHHYLLNRASTENWSCFYLGSSETTLHSIKRRLKQDFPNIKTGFHSPPFKTAFTEDDNQLMIQAVNDFKPNVLFVGMTAPKQEKWTHTHKDALDAGLICSIGAVFDFYAGTVKRPGKIWIDLGLEWLGRLLREPRRMWKRYIYHGAVFGYYLFREKLRPVKSKPSQGLHEGDD